MRSYKAVFAGRFYLLEKLQVNEAAVDLWTFLSGLELGWALGGCGRPVVQALCTL